MNIFLIVENVTDNIVYHGSENKFETFRDSDTYFFVDNLDIAKTYGPYITKAKLNLSNPIELDFEGKSTFYFYDKWYIPSELALTLKDISKYYMEDDMRDYLLHLGFDDNYGKMDGIIMRNIKDSHGDIFSNLPSANNYVVFNKNQIKILK